MIIGMPILIATVIAFMPAAFFQEFPQLLRPIVGNGFVVGVIIVLLMEHGIFRKSGSQKEDAGRDQSLQGLRKRSQHDN
jgi:xanthine/uracil permease